MVYYVLAEVRYLIGSIDSGDISDSDINAKGAQADAYIDLKTHRTWSSGDDGYKVIQQISNLLASCWIRKGYDDTLNVGQSHCEQGELLLDTLIKESPLVIDAISNDSTQTQNIIIAADYQTYPLNPDASVYRSLKTPYSNPYDGGEGFF